MCTKYILSYKFAVQLNDKEMATIKKPSKASVKQIASKDYFKALLVIEKGGKLISTQLYNKVEYGVQYTTGGYFRITKTIYDKLNDLQ
jgi:hypothetical protein